MILKGLHILLTYQCTFECDHCFVWGSPWQQGTLTLSQIDQILMQAVDAGSVQWIYFEGGEPFLYYATLLQGVRRAAAAGFKVGIVTNGYWAISYADALEWLRPFAGLIQDLSISSDRFHYSQENDEHVRFTIQAAEALGIPVGTISIAQAGELLDWDGVGMLAAGESGVMFRGRAAEKLAGRVRLRPWTEFTSCPHEDLREPGRVHLDPLGNLHICQGISMGNLFEQPLMALCEAYEPDAHPVIGPLLAGGPYRLAEQYGLALRGAYADACHLCYRARQALRGRFPQVLGPAQVYGEF